MNIRTVLGSLVLFAACEAFGAQAPVLLRRSHAPIPPQEPDSSVLREVPVVVNIPAARDASRLRLPLFDGNRTLAVAGYFATEYGWRAYVVLAWKARARKRQEK